MLQEGEGGLEDEREVQMILRGERKRYGERDRQCEGRESESETICDTDHIYHTNKYTMHNTHTTHTCNTTHTAFSTTYSI